jgi:hypothetical protein
MPADLQFKSAIYISVRLCRRIWRGLLHTSAQRVMIQERKTARPCRRLHTMGLTRGVLSPGGGWTLLGGAGFRSLWGGYLGTWSTTGVFTLRSTGSIWTGGPSAWNNEPNLLLLESGRRHRSSLLYCELITSKFIFVQTASARGRPSCAICPPRAASVRCRCISVGLRHLSGLIHLHPLRSTTMDRLTSLDANRPTCTTLYASVKSIAV